MNIIKRGRPSCYSSQLFIITSNIHKPGHPRRRPAQHQHAQECLAAVQPELHAGHQQLVLVEGLGVAQCRPDDRRCGRKLLEELQGCTGVQQPHVPGFLDAPRDEVSDVESVHSCWDDAVNLGDQFGAALPHQREERLLRQVLALVETASQNILVGVGHCGNGLHSSSKPIQNSDRLHLWMLLQLIEGQVGGAEVGGAHDEGQLELL